MLLQQQLQALQTTLAKVLDRRDQRRRSPKTSSSGSSNLCSPASPSSHSSDPACTATVPCAPDFAALLLESETQRRIEQRERNAQRRVDCREANASVALLGAQLATLTVAPSSAPPAVVSPSSYVVGRALTSIPSFTGAATDDYDNYISDFQGKIASKAMPFRLLSGSTNSFSSLRVPPRAATTPRILPKIFAPGGRT